MFKEILLLAASVTPYIQEPQRAVLSADEYEIVNATSSVFMLYQSYSDEEVDFSAKSVSFYPYKVDTSENFGLFLYKSVYPSAPSNFYYMYKASDFEDPVSITFSNLNDEFWYASIEAYEPSRGLQIGRYESLNGTHAYIDTGKFGITGLSSIIPNDTLYNLLAETGVTRFQYVSQNGSLSSAFSNIVVYKNTDLKQGTIPYVTLQSVFFNSTTSVVVARNRLNGDTSNQPTLYFTNSFTNEVVFNDGHKVIRYGELDGSLPYFFSVTDTGYMSENTATGSIGLETLTTGFELGGLALSLLGSSLGWMIFPGISIGLLLLFPLILSLFVWLIKFLKKG